MRLPLLLLVCCASCVVAQFVNHYEVLNVPENATSSEIGRAYKSLAVKLHPDKGGDSDRFVALTEAYAVLKSPDSRREFDVELGFYRKHGTVRWGLRYRVYPRTNVWVVLLAFIFITMGCQWYLRVWWHRRMTGAARDTDAYRKEQSRRLALGLDPHDIVVEVKGAEAPVWWDLWPVQLALLPYRVYVYVTVDRPRLQAEQEAFMREYNAMTNREKAQLGKRIWKQKMR